MPPPAAPLPPASRSRVRRLSGAGRFATLRSTRHRVRSGALRVAWVPAGDGGSPDAHVGFAIGRRVGTAVVRNRLRRRLRNILSGTPIGPGDYLVSVDPLAATVSYSELKALVSHALQALPPTPPHPTPTP